LLSDIRFPSADDSTIFTTPCVDNDVKTAVQFTEAYGSGLAIVEAVVGNLKDWSFENRQDVDEIDLPIANISRALCFIPFEADHLARR
jgi:hypothetical protein